MKYDVTFLVITYNQEKYILECLESIKHQRIKHLSDKRVQLAITDDASPDKTFELVGTWIARNRQFFDECIVNRNETNLGINRNLREGFKLVNGVFLKMIAGDDLLPRQSVAVFFEILKDYDFVMGLPIYFSSGKEIKFFQQKTVGHIANEFLGNGKPYIQRLNRDCFVHGPSVYLRAKLVKNENVTNFMKKFSFLEDYPMWYGMGKSLPNIRYKFIETPAILYRRTTDSAYLKCPMQIYDDRIRMAQYILSSRRLRLYDYLAKKNELLAFFLARRFRNYRISTYLNIDNYIQKIGHMFFEWILPVDYRDLSRIIQGQKSYIEAIERLAKMFLEKEEMECENQ